MRQQSDSLVCDYDVCCILFKESHFLGGILVAATGLTGIHVIFILSITGIY